jgi:glyoxylase-like metal-dependent hydrolase (beta-lactamase superfamily II)
VNAIGDQYEVTIVKYGTRTATRSEVFLNFPLYHEDDAPIGMDYFFWIVRNRHRTVVVDTGFSPAGGSARKRTFLADVPTLFRRFGVEPLTSPTVVLTHAHYDHAGNLGLFPAATVVMAESELRFWSSPHAHRTLFHHSVDNEDLSLLRSLADDGRLSLFQGSISIAPGIEVIEMGGHTPGQSIVKVNTSEGVVLLASDALHYYEELERDMIFTSVSDIVRMYECFDRIRDMMAAGEVDHLVSGHDPDTLSRFKGMAGEHGELAASIGSLG